MKYLLLAALALAGCAEPTIDLGKASNLPEPPTTLQTAIGFDSTGCVSYTCEQSEVAPALVWDICTFHNFVPTPSGMCLQVSYNLNDVPVATSRAVCSGLLQPGEDKKNYAAFTPKHGREDLESKCGSNMVLCTMSVQEVK
jgi:hypothetical protein